jgi:DNA-binding beta-propeller fold protein YncE
MRVLEPGSIVGGYRIESYVGRGGMGVVYRALDTDLERIVALKVIAPELIDDDTIRGRFLREARAAAAIEHPNVIPVHAAGEDGALAFIAMRLVDGEDLRRHVKRAGPLAPERAAQVIEQAATGLDAIHHAGFVHRDLKPANLLLDRSGHVYVTDFGLVKQVLTQSGPTASGQWVGSLDYISPEQIRGGRIDARADVYALGGVLYFALTGRVPFERDGDEAKLWAQLSEPAPRPSEARRGLGGEFDAVVARAMRKTPGHRFPSAGDLARAARIAAGDPLSPQPERMVARGAAAPEGAESEPGIAPEADTISAQRETLLLPTKSRRRWALPALLGVVGVVAAAAIFLIGDDPAPEPSAGAAVSVPTPALRVASVTADVGWRPNLIVYAAGDLWVASHAETAVTRIDAATGEVRAHKPQVGRGVTSLAVDRDRVWAAVAEANTVLALDARTGRRERTIPLGAKPVRLRADVTGLWVLMAPRTHHGQRLLHFDRDGNRRLGEVRLRRTHRAIAVGAGSVWLGDVGRRGVLRLDARTRRRQDFIRASSQVGAMSFAHDYLWIADGANDKLVRIDPRTEQRATIATGDRPTGAVAVAGHLVVAARDENTLRAYDPDSTEPVGPPVTVPLNPSAMATDGRSVWVTGLAKNTVTRIVAR